MSVVDSVSERGIVINPPFEYFERGLLVPDRLFDASSLRQYLLYWDRIDWPENNLANSESPPDVQFLIDVGVLERTMVHLPYSDQGGTRPWAIAQETVLKQRNARAPGAWALAQQGRRLVLSTDSAPKAPTIEIELYNAMPVPSDAVSLADVLEFKQRRRDELLAFRYTMDALYLEIVNASDLPRAKLHAIDAIQRSLVALHTVFNESWTSKLLSTVKVGLNADVAAKALVGMGAAAILNVPLEMGAALGGTLAAIKFDLTTIIRPKIPDALKDYAYLHSISEDLR